MILRLSFFFYFILSHTDELWESWLQFKQYPLQVFFFGNCIDFLIYMIEVILFANNLSYRSAETNLSIVRLLKSHSLLIKLSRLKQNPPKNANISIILLHEHSESIKQE